MDRYIAGKACNCDLAFAVRDDDGGFAMAGCIACIRGSFSGRQENRTRWTGVHIEPRTVDVTWDDAVVDIEAIIGAIEEQGYEVAR